MFAIFVDTLNEWLNRQMPAFIPGFHPVNKPDLQESIPQIGEIRRHFLKAIVPPFYCRYFRYHSYHLEQLLSEIFSFSLILNENKIRNLIDASILGQLPQLAKHRICSKLLAFLQQQDNWNDGTWHWQLQENQHLAFDTLVTKLQFEDHWQCASFLAACGYLIPFSLNAAKGWSNWSGQPTPKGSFKLWWQQLADLSPHRSDVFKLDRLLDSLFNPECSILPIPLCTEAVVCKKCPLAATCRFLVTKINPDRTRVCVNAIKTGDSKDLSQEDLLLLLVGESWNGTDFQQRLLNNFPDIGLPLAAETKSPVDEEMLVKMLGIKELVASINQQPADPPEAFTCAAEIFNYFKHTLGQESQEFFYTVILDNKHRIISKRLISLGTLNQSLVHPREVFAPAIQLRAAAIILVHNHPSGDPTPSNQDIAITQRLQDVGEIVGIKVLDHVIIGSQDFFSFVDDKLIRS